MSLLSPRLQLKVAQKQILTPGLVQMVTVLQLNRLELKEMITQEIVKNPVLEESSEEPGEEITAEELLPLLEAEPVIDAADKQLLEMSNLNGANSLEGANGDVAINGTIFPDVDEVAASIAEPDLNAPIDPLAPETPVATDPFDEIDFGSFFDDYLDPGYKSPASESVEKPSFETFLSAPVTLGDHLRSQLSVSLISDEMRDAAESIIGNLDEDGYVSASLDEIALAGEHKPELVDEALRVVQSLDPAGVGARNLRECLLLQIESVNGKGGVAWQIVSNQLRLLETRQFKEIAKALGRRWSTSISPSA
jgi:RNA polymerase sigma-54 factor